MKTPGNETGYNQDIANVFLFHGTSGTPKGNWFPWLQKELEGKGHTVIAPSFPDSDHPNLSKWMTALATTPMTSDSILVGHSLGGTMILRVLEKLSHPIFGTFLIAPVEKKMGNDFDPLIATFIDHPFNWEMIRANRGKMSIFHADDDPYVPLSQARNIADHTGSSLKVIAGGKHLNRSAGFSTFPLLRDTIFSILP